MKSNYKRSLEKRESTKARVEAYLEGFHFALNLTAIALNNLFGMGESRLRRLEVEVNRLVDEEFGEDIEIAEQGMKIRLKQIMKTKEGKK